MLHLSESQLISKPSTLMCSRAPSRAKKTPPAPIVYGGNGAKTLRPHLITGEKSGGFKVGVSTCYNGGCFT